MIPALSGIASGNRTIGFKPRLLILAAGAVSHALSGRFESFYPLRWLAGVVALFLYRSKLLSLDWHFSWRGPVVGAMVFVIWIAAAHATTNALIGAAVLIGGDWRLW